MSVATDVDWFSVETDEILVELTKQDFQISLSAIDALERRAERRLATEALRAARTSCADLRLDAAIFTRQSYEYTAFGVQTMSMGTAADWMPTNYPQPCRAEGGTWPARDYNGNRCG